MGRPDTEMFEENETHWIEFGQQSLTSRKIPLSADNNDRIFDTDVKADLF